MASPERLRRGDEERNPTRNRILKRLAPAEFERLAPSFVEVPVGFKETLFEQDRPVDNFFFMEAGVASFVTELEGGDSVETGTVGREGFVDVATFLGMPRATGTAFCQIPGRARRIPAPVIFAERDRNTELARLMMRFTAAFLAMVSQSAACNRAHPVEERMARWLLMTHDCVDGDEFPLTQEFLAQMLGVRRPSVNIAGLALQQAGVIRYSRGRIAIVDRRGLESSSCECYAEIKKRLDEALRV